MQQQAQWLQSALWLLQSELLRLQLVLRQPPLPLPSELLPPALLLAVPPLALRALSELLLLQLVLQQREQLSAALRSGQCLLSAQQ